MGCKIVLSRGAEKDLENIVEFISKDKPDVGERIGREIVRQLRLLENFPRIERVVPEFGDDNLREVIHSPYRLIYEINDDASRIEVIRVWHGARGNPELGTND